MLLQKKIIDLHHRYLWAFAQNTSLYFSQKNLF